MVYSSTAIGLGLSKPGVESCCGWVRNADEFESQLLRLVCANALEVEDEGEVRSNIRAPDAIVGRLVDFEVGDVIVRRDVPDTAAYQREAWEATSAEGGMA